MDDGFECINGGRAVQVTDVLADKHQVFPTDRDGVFQ